MKKKKMKTTRKRSSGKRFGVFDFNEADKRVEKVSKNNLSKYGNPNSTHNISPLTKYDFLRCFAQGTKSKRKDSINEILDVDASDAAVKEAISVLDVTAPSGSSDYNSNTCPNYSYAARPLNHGATCAGTKHLKNEPITINSDGDDDIELNSSTSTSDLAENEGPLKEKELENCFGGCVADTTIVVSPDYIIYRDTYCNKSLLTFSSRCIKVEGSAGCGIRGPFSFEWTVGDIINIESQWCGKVETAVLNLHLRSKDPGVAENTNSGPGIAELQFAVFDPNWSEVQESIKLLNVTYKVKWNLVSNTDTARSQYSCLGNNNIFFSKHNFSNLDEYFEEVIYPKGDPDAVSLSKRDIELLQPETFINDTIIDFYIKYLKNKIKPEEKHRFHFFNSFFFRKLADLDKDPCNAREGRAAFQRVRKWTRKVDLFEKDYIFIPVNFSLHWSLIVICHPGDVANIGDEDVEKLPKVPCILHMDSIKGSHRGLKNLIQSYLWEEWKERKNQLLGEVSSRLLNLRFVSLELPQQENSFDCGIFLLHYVELFLDQAPVGFSPFKLTKFSSFLSKDWFPPSEASLKRAHIKQLIHEIVEDSSLKASSAPCNDHKNPSSESPSIDERDNGAKLLLKICNSPELCHRNYSSCIADQEIEITPSAASSLRGVHCSKERDLIFRVLEPRATGGLLLDGRCQSSRQLVALERFKNVMSPIEEVEEILEQQFASSTDKASFQQLAEVTEPPMPVSVASSFPVDSIHIEESEDEDTFLGTSIGGSPVSSEVGKKEVYLPAEVLSSNPEAEKDKSESPLSSSDGSSACVVEDSEEEDVHETEKSPFHLGKILGSSCQEVDLTENVQANDILIVSDLEEEPASKRPSGRRLRRSLWKDVQ